MLWKGRNMYSPSANHLNDYRTKLLIATLFDVLLSISYLSIMFAVILPLEENTIWLACISIISIGIPTVWVSYRLYNCIYYKDHTVPMCNLMLRQLRVFITSLRVPIIFMCSETWAFRQGHEPAFYWSISLPMAIWLPNIISYLFRDCRYHSEYLRGSRLINQSEVDERISTAQHPTEELLDWAGIGLPEHMASGHFVIVGATESGKTVTMRLLMQSVLPAIYHGSKRRAVIYDAKQDMIEILGGMFLQCPVIILNPFDARSSAWDMACDVTNPATALQVAQILIPDEQGGYNTFFIKAARDLVAAILLAHHLTKPGKWILADIVLTLSDTQKSKSLLYSLSQTQYIAQELFNRDPRTLANIQSTISAHMAMLRPIAAMWAQSPQKISLKQWIQNDCILVLGNDEALRGPLDALNRVIFQRMVELVLAEPESDQNRTWFFIDEVKEAGRLDALSRLMTKGRTKGARVVLAFQTIEGLRAVYGEELANELAGMATNKALLRTDSPTTAQWAAHVIGEHEHREWTRTISRGIGSGASRTEHIVKRETVLASELMQLPTANQRQYTGFFVIPGVGIFQNTIIFFRRLWFRGSYPNFVSRPESDQYLVDPYSSSDPNSLDGFERIGEHDINDLPPPLSGGDEDDDYPFYASTDE